MLAGGRRYGFRNAQVTVLAPTGTISFMMDCCTTGIEPDIALVKYKQLAGGGTLKIINRTVPLALESLGYEPDEVASICDYVEKEGTIEGPSGLRPEHLPVFDCAFLPPGGTRSIPWRAHVRMMAAAQPFISGAISKTVNMPNDATVEDCKQSYMLSWRLALKANALYRDGSKLSQPLNSQILGESEDEQDETAEKLTADKPAVQRAMVAARHAPRSRTSSASPATRAISPWGCIPTGGPARCSLRWPRGSTIGGLMDCFGTAVSMSLQYGVPLEVYVQKFSHTRFEPMGPTKNPDIRIAKSIVDYIFRWLGVTFIPGFREANKGLPYGDSPRK